jgi:hypothetical protein
MNPFHSKTVYLAGRYGRRDELSGYRYQLEALGFTVTSRWLDGGHPVSIGANGEGPSAEQERYAEEDIDDLMAATVVINFTEQPYSKFSRGGRHVEFGIAIAQNKFCVICGPRENVFHHMKRVGQCDDWERLLRWLPAFFEAQANIESVGK